MLLSNARETVTISYTHYDYILVNRGKSESTVITFHFYYYDWCNEYSTYSSVSFHSACFSFIIEAVALGFGYAINPLFSAAVLKETDDFWSNKGNLKDPTIKDDLEPRSFDPTLINSITILVCTLIAIYVVWKIIKTKTIQFTKYTCL